MQSIIVYIIIAAAVGYIIYSLVNSLKKREQSNCGGCDGCELTSTRSSCDTKENIITVENININK